MWIKHSSIFKTFVKWTDVTKAGKKLSKAHKNWFHVKFLNFSFFSGIRAKPLDSSYYHWQASITGPVGSPYEGGVFYLYLKVPFTYPFNPPEVRFLTRIFHPNVSRYLDTGWIFYSFPRGVIFTLFRHGDIGIDSILQHGWVSGLTIPKGFCYNAQIS